MTPLLNVKGLTTRIRSEHGNLAVVDDVSLQISAGETLGLVGESGSGKSMTALSIMGLLPRPDSYLDNGCVDFDGTDIAQLNSRALAQLRGNEISMIFQDPMTALNPVKRVGEQILEVLEIHKQVRGKQGPSQVVDLLRAVGIPHPNERFDSYPHELSGGMRQRVMIAMALACRPRLLIADEPTTALDVTVQAQILRLIKQLQQERDTALLFITHDLALVSQISDRIAVMYAGHIVECASTSRLFSKALHPYTRALLASTPSVGAVRKERLSSIPGAVAKPATYSALCRFRNRCSFATERCSQEAVSLETTDTGQQVRCLRWRELAED